MEMSILTQERKTVDQLALVGGVAGPSTESSQGCYLLFYNPPRSLQNLGYTVSAMTSRGFRDTKRIDQN